MIGPLNEMGLRKFETREKEIVRGVPPAVVLWNLVRSDKRRWWYASGGGIDVSQCCPRATRPQHFRLQKSFARTDKIGRRTVTMLSISITSFLKSLSCQKLNLSTIEHWVHDVVLRKPVTSLPSLLWCQWVLRNAFMSARVSRTGDTDFSWLLKSRGISQALPRNTKWLVLIFHVLELLPITFTQMAYVALENVQQSISENWIENWTFTYLVMITMGVRVCWLF
jgi:hypothetical protein